MIKAFVLPCIICGVIFGCFAESSTHMLLFTKSDSIWSLDLETDNVTKIIDTNTTIRQIDYHYGYQYIYWTGSDGRLSRVHLLSLKKSEEVLIEPGNGYYCLSVAVDYFNDQLFWTDSNNSAIRSSALDGSNKRTVASNIFVWFANHIQVDPDDEWIYYSNFFWGIQRIKFDGSEKRTVIDQIIFNFALDIVENMIYWANGSYIMTATSDGSDVAAFAPEEESVNGIDVDEEHMYFIDYVTREIKRRDKKTRKKLEIMYRSTENIFLVLAFRDKGSKCRNYSDILNAEKRSTGYELKPTNDQPISDDILEDGWYRIYSINGDEMATSPPGVLHCGTNNPIWLNGSLPSRGDGNITRMACVQTEDETCNETLDIEIKNCGHYYIFFLQSTPVNSSYCFGQGPVLCQDGMSSETGFYPGCSSSYPKDKVSGKVEAELIEGGIKDGSSGLIPIFRCDFKPNLHESYFIDVKWDINGQNIKNLSSVPINESESSVLLPNDWITSHKMNMKVTCAIRLRYHSGSVPSPWFNSAEFDAGIFPEKLEYTVIEGESVNISFTSTVPVGCDFSNENLRKHCEQNFYVFQPNDNQQPECRNNIASRDIVFEAAFCGFSVGSIGWNISKTLRVHGYSDGMYNLKDRSAYIRLSTLSSTPNNELWNDIQIPDIKVTVKDKDSLLTSRICQSSNDPHIRTFDGKYYHYMEIGEFVMYKNDIGPYWVHALFTNCGFGWSGSACHCGIAVRSRNSLFVLRTCESISRDEKHMLNQPITELTTCDDEIKVENTGNSYTITLPIGTVIQLTVSRWSKFISSITIKPSIFDIDEAKGLCGVPNLSKDPSDDYFHRIDGPITNDQTFGDSWKVTLGSEQLFVEDPEFLSNEYVTNIGTVLSEYNDTTYCVCERQATSTDSLDDFNSLQCNLTSSTEPCSFGTNSDQNTINAFNTKCTKTSRIKRSADTRHTLVKRSVVDDDDSEYKPLVYNDDVTGLNREVRQNYTNGWTDTKARQSCSESIKEAIPSELYSGLMDINEEFFIESCMKDIQLVGDTIFISDTIGAMSNLIQTELSRNESLLLEKSSDGSQTMIDYISSFLCPKNCSNNGNCTRGVCFCFDGYVSDDCSQSISTPLSDITASFSGLCTIGTRKCESINIYGDFLSTKVWCRINHYEILKASHQNISVGHVSRATYRNMFMVSVALPAGRRKRSVSPSTQADGYDISLSHDGIHFGNSITVIVYDENCYSCNSTDVSCIDLNVCRREEDDYTDNEKSGTMIAAVVSFVCVAVVVGLSVVIVYKIKSKKQNKLVDSSKSKHDSENGQKTTPRSNVKMDREITSGQLDLHFDETGPRTPVELFQIPLCRSSTAKLQFDVNDLKHRQFN